MKSWTAGMYTGTRIRGQHCIALHYITFPRIYSLGPLSSRGNFPDDTLPGTGSFAHSPRASNRGIIKVGRDNGITYFLRGTHCGFCALQTVAASEIETTILEHWNCDKYNSRLRYTNMYIWRKNKNEKLKEKCMSKYQYIVSKLLKDWKK